MVYTGKKKDGDEETPSLTAARIYDLVCIELGLSEWEFWSSTPRKTYIMQLANQRQRDRKWERTRYLASMVHNMALGKKRDKTPQQLVPLSIDRMRVKEEEISKELAQHLVDIWVKPAEILRAREAANKAKREG